MKPFRLALGCRMAAVLVFASLGVPLQAQILDHPAYYTIYAQPTVTGNGGGMSGTLVDETGAVCSLSMGAGPGVTEAGGWRPAKLVPNKDYTVSITVPRNGTTDEPLISSGSIEFRPPTGFGVYINNLYTRTRGIDPEQSLQTFTVRIAVPGDYTIDGPPDMARGGESSSLVTDKPIWYVGLGRLRNGGSAGAVGFRRQIITSDLFTRSALYYHSPDAAEADFIYDDTGLRQVFSREVLLDLKTVTTSSYTIDVYARSQVGAKNVNIATASGTRQIYSLTGSPFLTYKVESISSGSGIQITRTEDSVSWVTSLTLSSSGSIWTHKAWYCATGSLAPTVTTSNFTDPNNVSVSVTGPGSGLTGDTALAWTKAFNDYGWGRELTGTTFGASTAVPLNSSYSYDSASTTDGVTSLLTSSTDPSGNWTKYDYFLTTNYADSVDGVPTPYHGAAGQVFRVYRPWKDGPTDPGLATTANSVVDTYSYEQTYQYPIERTTTAPSGTTTKTIGKTTWVYAELPAPLNGMTVVSKAETDYTSASQSLTTIRKDFSRLTAPYAFRDLPVSVTYPDGRKDSYAYLNGSWDASSKTFTVSSTGADRWALVFHGQTSGTTYCDKWPNDPNLGWNMDRVYVEAGKSTITARVIDSTGRPVFSGEYVWVSASSWQLISGTTVHYDSHGRIDTETDVIRGISTTHAFSTWETASCPQTVRTTAPNGLVTRTDYDALMRPVIVTSGENGPTGFPAHVRTTDYDAANRPVRVTDGTAAGGYPTRYFYDAAGRMTTQKQRLPTETSGDGNLTTSFAYTDLRSMTVTSPTGVTQTSVSYLDGHPQSVTSSAPHQPPVAYDYAFDTSGNLVATVTSGMTTGTSPVFVSTSTTSDWLGRTTTQDSPGFSGARIVTTTHYDDTTGLLDRQTIKSGGGTPLAPDHLYLYDAAGRLTYDGLDVDGRGALTTNSADRLTGYDSTYKIVDSNWWFVSTVSTYPTLNSGTAVSATTQTRITGLGATSTAGVLSGETVTIDANGRRADLTTYLDGTNKTVTVFTAVDGAKDANMPSYQSSINGYDFEVRDSTGAKLRRTYDSLGRLSTVLSRWNGSSFGATDSYAYFNNSGFVQTQTVAGVVITYGYAWQGANAPRSVSAAITGGGTTTVVYDLADRPWRTFGSGASPSELGYDDLGRQKTLTTWTSGSFSGSTWPSSPGAGNTTTWTLDTSSGLATSKTFADGKHVDYTYTTIGQVKTYTNARTPTGTTISYDYYDGSESDTDVNHLTQALKSVTYTDGTPNVSYVYGRNGLLSSVTDATIAFLWWLPDLLGAMVCSPA